MRTLLLSWLCYFVVLGAPAQPAPPASGLTKKRKTEVTIVGPEFYINGEPTYKGRLWEGYKIQGLLLNARMIQGIFDDLNPATRQRWQYPDKKEYSAERNTREYIAAMPAWRKHGLLNITLNLQGGSPEGYSKEQPWENNAFEPDGSLRPDYFERLEKILDKADELGMVVTLGYFYFGQDQRLENEAAVIRAVDDATRWVLRKGYRHVLIEINNECNISYDHAILQPERVHELIGRVQQLKQGDRRLLVSTSYGGGFVPLPNVVAVADFLLIHGNGVSDPNRIAEMVRQTRAVKGYTPKPILFNEDDHFDFDKAQNNCRAAISEYASWGYFDPGKNNYEDGYQSMPVNWRINTPRKQAFFNYLQTITGVNQKNKGSK
jgi:hypothetical protein